MRTIPHNSNLPKPPKSDRIPSQSSPPPSTPQPHQTSFPKSISNNNNSNNNNNHQTTSSTTPIKHLHSHSTSTLQSSLPTEEQLGLGGPQSLPYFSTSHIELNPWRGCAPCKWKVPLLESGLPNHPQSNNRDTLTIDDDVEETHYQNSHVEEEEWKIRWAKLSFHTYQETPPADRNLSDELKPQIANQLHSLKLHFVFDSPENPQLGLLVWVYEIPGRLGPKSSNTPPDHSNDQFPPLIDPILKTYQSYENHTPICDSPIIACQAVLSHGVLSYSQLFPNIFSRSATATSKPLLPHLSHPAKNRTANDFLVDDSNQTNTIPAYANLLRALNQHVIALAVQSPDSTAFPGACPTRWIRWGPDRLLSIPREESLEHLYRNLNHDSTRLLGTILATAPALMVELKCWLSSRVAMCQPSFTARRLAPMPTLQQHNIPPGFPLILAPFPNLRAQYVRMFGRFNHQSLTRSKLGTNAQSPTSSIGRSSWPCDPSIPNSSWISQQKRICRAELKHFEKLKQTWKMAAPFMEAYPESSAAPTINSTQRNLEGWVVCKITSSGAASSETNQGPEIELVWPVDHCLLDLETWIAHVEQYPIPPPAEADQPVTLMSSLSGATCPPRARLASSLILSDFEPTNDLAEDAGSYIDWVAQERELQRRAAATAGKEKTNEKTESPSPSMTVGRAGLGPNRCRGGSGYPSPRYQRHTSTSTAQPSPGPPHLMTPRLSKKRLRDDSDDRFSSQPSATTPAFHLSITALDCGITRRITASNQNDPTTVDFTANGLSDEIGVDIFNDSSGSATTTHLPDPPASQPQASSVPSGRDEQFPSHNISQSSSAALVLSSQLVTTSPQFVSAQKGSGSGSTASTISYNTNLFEQPTPGSLSISGLTPGRLNGFTPDATHNFNNNHVPVQPATLSPPINPNPPLIAAEPNQVDQLAISEHALRTLSLMPSSEPPSLTTVFRFAEPLGYESVHFSRSHTVVDDHYTRRGGKYALPPSPHSLIGPEDEHDGLMDIANQEPLRTARGTPLLVHVSKKLMQAIDPRVKVARTLFSNAMQPTVIDSQQQPFSRVEPLTSSTIASAHGATTGSVVESPATPRSWMPIGSPNGSTDCSTCSDEEDEPDGNAFAQPTETCHRDSCSSTISSCSSDDERMMALDSEYQNDILKKIEQIEGSLKDVLEAHYRSNFFLISSTNVPFQNCVLDDRSRRPPYIPSSVRKKLKNWVSQLAAQLEHDANLEVLLETVLPKTINTSSSSSNSTPAAISDHSQGEERVVLDLASLPAIHGFDYYRSRVDDEYEIQENRHRNNQKKGEEESKLGRQQKVTEDEGDQRPYLIKKLTKLPTSIVVKINEGKQKIAFSLISHLFKYWIKLGFEPVAGQRDSILSVIFPRPRPPQSSSFKPAQPTPQDPTPDDSATENLCDNNKQRWQGLLHLNLPAIHHWLLELANTYKSCRLGELSIGNIYESKYQSGELKKEIEGMISEISGSKMIRHTCLIVVDRLEDMNSLGIGEEEIVGLDGRPVTRLLISRHQLLDDRPASLISFALRLYDSMKIFVHRFRAPGLSFDPPLTSVAVDSVEPLADSEACSSSAGEKVSNSVGSAAGNDANGPMGERRSKRSSDCKLLSGHAFFLTGIQKPTQLNIRWPPSGIDVAARHRILHLGYQVGPHRSWVVVSTVDELGQQHQLGLKFLHPSNLPSQDPPQTHHISKVEDDHRLDMQVVSAVWQVIRKMLLSTNVEWRIVITKLGRLGPLEYEAWCELLSQTLVSSEIAFHVTLASVMLSDIPVLRRGPQVNESGMISPGVTEGGGEAGSELEMGEVQGLEEGEEGGRVGGSAQMVGEEGERMFGGPEPIWVSHESTIRPHSSYNDDGLLSRPSIFSNRPRSVNGTIVHSLSTSYIYHLSCPGQSGLVDMFLPSRNGSGTGGGGGRFRVDILGTAATSGSVYQANLFQHREEILHSLVQLCKLKSLRSGLLLHPHHSPFLPIHLSSLLAVGNALSRHLAPICASLLPTSPPPNPPAPPAATDPLNSPLFN